MNLQVACNRIVTGLMLTLGVVACSAGDTDSNNKHKVDFSFSGEATPTDAGLPAYPGSKPYLDSDQTSSAANLGLSTPLFGFKVVAMNLETPDEWDRVAAFYKQALSRYGNVVECSDTSDNRKNSKSSDEHSNELVCDSSDPGTHKVVYKVGTKKNQRIVAIKPHGTGTRFSLVNVGVRE